MGLKYVEKKNFPQNLDQIIKIKPEELIISAYSRMLCQNCGLWGRAILCPPLLYKTYPQYRTIEKSREYFDKFDAAYIYIFKNDGSKRFWYKSEQEKYKHFRLIKVESGRQLKGIEIVGSRYITQTMFKVRKINRRQGYICQTFILGHCDKASCGHRCPNRGNPPCKHGGMPSLEATGINVYATLEKLGVEYQYPVMTYLTSVAMMIVRKK